ETAAVDLPRGRGQQLAHAQFGATVDGMAAFGKEEPEAELADLFGFEVFAQAEHVGEVVRADLDRGFADLERAFAHGVRAALDHRHRQRRRALAQLQREGQSGEAAAEDGDVGAERGRLGHVASGRRAGLRDYRTWPAPAFTAVRGAGADASGSKTTGGRARARRYWRRSRPWANTWPTTCAVIR